jgi:hypothetical protein
MKKTTQAPGPDPKFAFQELTQPLTVVSEGIGLLKEYFDGHQDLRRKQIFASVQTNLDRALALLKGFMDSSDPVKTESPSSTHFDILQQVQHVCTTHDQMFLQRQLRYRVTASADLPKVFANPNQIFVVLSHIISNAIKYTPRSSEIEIRIKEVTLRQGAGVEVSVINESPNFTEKDRYQIFEKFYSNHPEDAVKAPGMGLALCRDTVQRAGGQMWVDIPSKGKVSFAFVLPCADVLTKPRPKSHQTYKYDITIANYKELKDTIGVEKISMLLHRIEESVRKLVRYPIDVVAAFETNGVISTIYETQEGFASSVATRISQKLGEEDFKVGKTSVPVMFKYHLSVLQ